MKTARQNALCTSQEAQNEIIASCDDLTIRKIIQRNHEAVFNSVVAHEAMCTDSANDGQLSVSIWYIENGIPNERFVGFHVHQEGVSRKVIANTILTGSLNGS